MRPSHVLHFLLVVVTGAVLALLAPACGRSSLELETPREAGVAQSCGPSTCSSGCCDAQGVCRTGTDVRACGSIGERCSDCTANGFQLCDGKHVCGRDDSACSPVTCKGCCAIDEGRKRCLSGTEPTACGQSGEQCADCSSSGRACQASDQKCSTSSCTPKNCAGCCVGDQCLTGDSVSACGAGGTVCGTCASGQVCAPSGTGTGGGCTGPTTCGPQNCGGCCTASGQCVAGNDTTACGKGGQACSACPFSEICIPDGQPNERTCQTPSSCGPGNCAGCCVGDQCVIATTSAECGVGGKQCTTCTSGTTCDTLSGVCVTAGLCDPSNCVGCCVGDICAVGTQNTACGFGGSQCQNCVNQGDVCQSSVCQVPTCGPDTCKTGCCQGNTCVVGNQDGACGKPGGGQCQDCTVTDQMCTAGACVAKCGPGTCGGCCQPDGSCAGGFGNDACGGGGGACTNCTVEASFCNGLVVPRRCNSDQSTCPAPYGTCNGGVSTTQTPTLQKVCSDAELDSLAAACANGPAFPSCSQALVALSDPCSTCIPPFAHPFDERTGLWACAASFVDGNCRRATGCAAECQLQSCNQCGTTSQGQCENLVDGVGGQCGAFSTTATACTQSALAPGQLCSQFSYADFGQWLRSVGDHFCGNGP